ncbi:Hypp1206 [Branchiostoma lanceolatum]|uniref:Hypp1206 protein n=1 Tax=Branchiostoma lanceolatum TaxID=7740 RepID=A0A8J9ZH77_BRALA|nr:Hypp1206 [Branchiostoma lanceolatum]
MSTTTELADDKENVETDKVKRPTKRRSDDGGHQRLTNSKAWSSASRMSRRTTQGNDFGSTRHTAPPAHHRRPCRRD